MQRTLLAILFVCLICHTCGSPFGKFKPDEVKQSLTQLGSLFGDYKNLHEKMQLGDLTVGCALCGIAVNEVEGLVAENISAQVIVDTLEKDVCGYLPASVSPICDVLVEDVPKIIELIENKYTPSSVCIELGYCEVPFTPHTDPAAVPVYTVNLDLEPYKRWQEICSIPSYKANIQFLYNTVTKLMPDGGEYLGDLGSFLNNFYLPTDYAQEIQGCALALDIPQGWLTLLNLGYELSDACTSIVAQTPSGEILHARNMDFWAGMGFTDTLKNITIQADFQKSGRTVFHATTFVGYVGVLSGMKPDAFSVTINTRFYPQGVGDLFYEVVAAIMENNATLVSFLSRRVFENENNFDAAITNLSGDLLIADVYYTVAGVSAGQGAVISRQRQNASDIWRLDSPSRWFLAQTNYDHWTQPPWFDDRVVPANNGMNAIGQNSISLGGMLGVLTIKPVFNIQTTYSILASPAAKTYKSYTRWCPYPCVE